ncbi:MAG TPA: AAA family ATPase, partial [Allosphingosinicella sp.]|nr:AAA family ATPase [Allosphingosinicella sp.]
MALSRLVLSDFRNHADALLAPGPGLVVLTGENGAGKTNVLEAVSLLSPGRGLRGASLSEMAGKSGSGGFAVAARLGEVEIGTGTDSRAPERRQVRINGASASATSLSEWLSVLWLTPAMDRLFQEGASGRRRFLDRLVLALEPGHAVHAARYEAAMRARNKLLAEEGPRDEAWLSALEARMIDHGGALASARARTVELLSGRL